MNGRNRWRNTTLSRRFPTASPDFGALQNAIDGAKNQEIIYFLFDLPYFEGKDLRNVPLWARRAL
ncbi:hypothetical protein PQR41_45575, partial [Paraburkholderia xenovorans]